MAAEWQEGAEGDPSAAHLGSLATSEKNVWACVQFCEYP